MSSKPSSAKSLPQSATRAQLRGFAVDAAVLAVIFAGAIAIHIKVVGRVPTGSDPGNWLALGRELFGEQVMAADVAYPPVIPTVVAMASWFLSPIEALAAVGIASRLAVGMAIYVVLRPTGRVTAAFGAALGLMAGYQSEIFAFGGYPQLAGTAAAVLALNATVRYLRGPSRTALIAIAAFALLTALTHSFTMAVLLGGAAISVPALLVVGQIVGGSRTLVAAAVAFVPAGLAFAIWVLTPSLSGTPTVNPQGFGYGEAVELLGSFVRESPWVWGLLVVAALTAIGLGLYRKRPDVPIEAMAWIVSGGAVWVLLLEQRSLAFVQIGIIIAAATLPMLLSAESVPRRMATAVFVVIAVVGGIAAIQGIQRFDGTVYFYRVVTTDDLRTIRTLADVSEPGDIVLSSRGRNDHHLGWWIQGYAGIPTFTAANPSYLAFPDEQQQAEFALQVFAEGSDAERLRASAEARDIRFVVVDKRGPDAGWLASPAAQSLIRTDAGPNLVILRVP